MSEKSTSSVPDSRGFGGRPPLQVESREELRREIENAWMSGDWELESQSVDRAFLIKRDFGNPIIHLVLLLLTAGIGNLIYLWYRYSYKAQRHVIRVEKNDSTR